MRRRKQTDSPLESFIYDVVGTTFQGVGREIGVNGTTVARIARGEVTAIKAQTYESLLAWADRIARERKLPPGQRLQWTLRGDDSGAAA